MAENNFNPKTIYEDQREIVRAQPSTTDDKSPFSDGAFQDLDGYLVPRKGVHKLYNYRCYPWGLKARGGSKRWSNTTLPALPDRTGYSLTKSGTTVTKTVGDDFTSSDVGNYVVYDDGKHERVSAFISATEVTVETSTAHDASTAAWIRGPVNAKPLFHEEKRLWILFIDTRIFYSTINVPSWTEVKQFGINNTPYSSASRLREYDSFAVLSNENGLYKIDLDNYVYWQMNSAIPTTRITDLTKSTSKPYCRRATYTVSKLIGNGQNSNRFDTGVTLQQETGSVFPDSSNKDYGELWSTRPIGPADTTYQELVGAALTSPHDTVAGWQGYTVVQFGITINGDTYNVISDVTGVLSLEQVAERIQIGLRVFFSTATCKLETSGASSWFEIASPDEGGTVTVVTAGGGATDIGTAIMRCESGTGNVYSRDYTEVVSLWNLEIPLDPTTAEHDSHFNRYSLYSSLDVGVNGTDPVNGEGNNGELLIWNQDIPVAKAFVASSTAGAVTATAGTFVPGDVNSKLRFEDGSEQTIMSYVSPTQVTVSGVLTVGSQPAAIGGDNALSKPILVMTASQSGTTVTRTAGSTFAAGDVGRVIFWPDGTESLITEYTDANNVEVLESATIASTGACLHPTTRKWTDTVRDDPYSTDANLRSRAGNTDYILHSRFFIPLPSCNEIEVTQSMLWVVDRGTTTIHYSQADTSHRYQAGYYYEQIQREFIQDAVIELSEVNDILTLKCVKFTRGIDVNTFDYEVIDGAGTAIAKCTGSFEVDGNVGMKYYGGTCKAGKFGQIVITSEPGIRTFDGRTYGPDLADNRIKKILESFFVGYACCYDPDNGFTFWALDE